MPKVLDEIHLELVLKGTFVRDLLQVVANSLTPNSADSNSMPEVSSPAVKELVPIMVSIKDAAEILGIGRTAVYSLLGDGTLKSVRIGRRNLIPIDELKGLVERGIK
jgi:excisionase family DNA binding protein